MFKRCYEFAGVTTEDRIQITPAYGLWTAGIGFQLGAEKLGAMVVPMGPGNTDKQLIDDAGSEDDGFNRHLIIRAAFDRGS
jgi:phenylacetate-coenzyme A ligase PaaK-like adenylate-forming protein